MCLVAFLLGCTLPTTVSKTGEKGGNKKGKNEYRVKIKQKLNAGPFQKVIPCKNRQWEIKPGVESGLNAVSRISGEVTSGTPPPGEAMGLIPSHKPTERKLKD